MFFNSLNQFIKQTLLFLKSEKLQGRQKVKFSTFALIQLLQDSVFLVRCSIFAQNTTL